MKAWIVEDKKIGQYATVVYADTRNKARNLALQTEACEGCCYTSISAIRCPELDPLYHGEIEADWYDDDVRSILVSRYKWCCGEPDFEECRYCYSKFDCQVWHSYREDFGDL